MRQPYLAQVCGTIELMQSVEQALANLSKITDSPLFVTLGKLFQDAGHEIALVGGPVRDAFLGRKAPDLDFTTTATPDQPLPILRGHLDAHWTSDASSAPSAPASATTPS